LKTLCCYFDLLAFFLPSLVFVGCIQEFLSSKFAWL
jgi:hypothetical protein